MRVYGFRKDGKQIVKLDIHVDAEGDFIHYLTGGKSIVEDVREELIQMNSPDEAKQLSYCLVTIDGQKKSPPITGGRLRGLQGT